MRRILMLTAMGTLIALGSTSAAQAAAADKVGSTLKVKYKGADPDDPYAEYEFKGAVGPKKCAKGRMVKIKGEGSEKTTANGKFTFTLSGPADPGRYKVKVAAKQVGKVSCSKVKTTLTVPRLD